MSRSPIFALILVCFFDAFGIGLVYPLFSALLFDPSANFVPTNTSDGTRGLWLGILLSTMPLVQMIVSPFVGSLSDRMGRRPIILITLSCAIVGYFIATLSIAYQSLPGLLVFRILLGFSASSYAVSFACVTDIYSTDDKVRYFARMNMAFGAGFAMGPLIGGVVTGETIFWTLNYARPFIVSCLLSICSLLAVYKWLPETLDLQKNHETPKNSLFKDLLDIDMPILFMLGAIFFLCFGWAFYSELIPTLWITQFKMSPTEVGFFFAYGAFWYMSFCRFIPTFMMKRFAHLHIFELAAFSLCCSIWILFVFRSKEAFWIAIPFQNLAMSCFFPISATVISEMAPKDQQGKIMGLQSSADSLGMGIGPIISGALLGINLFTPIIVGGLAAFCAGWIVRYIRYKYSQIHEIRNLDS